MPMNINDLRNVVLDGQVVTIDGQKKTWEIYAERTGEDVTDIQTDLDTQKDSIKKLYVPPKP